MPLRRLISSYLDVKQDFTSRNFQPRKKLRPQKIKYVILRLLRGLFVFASLPRPTKTSAQFHFFWCLFVKVVPPKPLHSQLSWTYTVEKSNTIHEIFPKTKLPSWLENYFISSLKSQNCIQFELHTRHIVLKKFDIGSPHNRTTFKKSLVSTKFKWTLNNILLTTNPRAQYYFSSQNYNLAYNCTSENVLKTTKFIPRKRFQNARQDDCNKSSKTLALLQI
jgi:hypothetical protein